jgi:viroplasmin and RNaseH domain-containing protein
MPISFTEPENEPILAATEYDEESEEENEEDDDADSRVSASEFDGDLSTIPKRMMFGEDECGAIFSLSSDNGAFMRVCGCNINSCLRDGHRTARLTSEGTGKPGSYETVRSRKFVDGKVETWIPVEVFEAELRVAKAKQDQALHDAGSFLKERTPEAGKGTSPTLSEDDAYASAYGRHPPWAMTSPGVMDRKPAPKELVKAFGNEKVKKDSKERVVPPTAPPGVGGTKEEVSQVAIASMMELMAGVRDSLKEVAGGMQELRKDRERVAATIPMKDERTEGGWKPLGGKVSFGLSQSPGSFLQEGRTDSGEWYAVAKGKDGACGVFDNYEEAKGLVYRVSGAVWKKFKFYEDAWKYLQDHMNDGAEEDTGWFYGVANGKEGFNGVLIDYPTAKKLVDKISGATWKKFRTQEDAFDFVQSNRRSPRAKSRSPSRSEKRDHGRPKEEEHGSFSKPPYQYSKEEPSGTDGMDWRNSRKDPHPEQGFPSTRGESREGLRPPIELAGEDPSMKKEDELWGVDVGAGERAMREKLCPPGLPTNIQRSMIDGMVDAVATPGGSIGGVEEELSGTEILGQAMEELVYQGRGGEDGGRKAELSWRHHKNTTLRKLTTQEKLRKQIKILVKLREKIPKRIVKACKNGLIRAGWTDPLLIEAWSQGGFLMRIARDSMDYYLSLHQHLMGLASSEVPWSYVQVEIDHHVEELDLIRSSADSRIQAILSLYCYLRDGVSSNWHSSSLQYKRNLDAMIIGSGASGDSSTLLCTKCQTSLHSGGKGNCPWRTLSDNVARKKGSTVLSNWANGVCAPACPPDT